MTLIKKNIFFDFLLKDLSKSHRIVAPQTVGGSVEYSTLKEEPEIHTFPPVNSIKAFLFPRSEQIFTFNRREGRLESPGPVDERDLLFFGVRSCDVEALTLFDTLFAHDYEDTSYLDRRRSSTIISIACNNPASDCFCTSVGGSPFGRKGCDLLATELDDSFTFEAFTKKGEDLIQQIGGEEASDGDKKRVEELEKRARSQMTEHFPLQTVREKIGDTFETEYWDDFSAPCLSCSICTFLCPSCHCFDITDMKTRKGSDRIRTWDSCMGPSFTLQASGHNPRHAKYKRWRQRVFHKFEYLPENLGILGCVGCGRCVTHCPVRIDIRRMLQIVCGMADEVTEVARGG